MTDWLELDINKTIREFDFTDRTVQKMICVLDSKDFESKSAEEIFRFLNEKMEMVFFGDYLKRYIYEKASPDISFAELGNQFYQEVIIQSFSDNHAPYSFSSKTVKRATAIRKWLTQKGSRRDTVFILGFGLRMPDEDVSLFLTKVIKEEDFDFYKPEEVVYWFCYKNQMPYSFAKNKLDWFENALPSDISEKRWTFIMQNPKMNLITEQVLDEYLLALKARNIQGKSEDAAYKQFVSLYNKSKEIIASWYDKDPVKEDPGKRWTPDDIQPGDLEKALCSGIPVNSDGNLKKISDSVLAEQFQYKRMSRQRLSKLLSRERPVDRFDLITLQFFIYGATVEPYWSAERYLQFLDASNKMLEGCGMIGLYPANPYDAFILMCILTEYPLDSYAAVWEKSFTPETT